MSDAEARLQRIKEQNKARAKRYYEANKPAIAKRRKEAREACRQALGKVAKKAPAPEPAPVAEPAPEPAPAPRPRVKRPKTVAQAKQEEEAKAKMMSLKQAEAIIATTDNIKSDSSRDLYKSHLKTVMELLHCDDLITCFQNAPETIKKLEDAKQKRDPTKPYALNSKKSFVQMILKLSDVLSIPLSAETKQEYVDAFDALKLDSRAQTEARQEEAKKEEGLTFAEYLPKVAKKYGNDSKEFLIASLYSIHGFRDNLQLRMVKAPDDEGDNQLIVPSKKGQPYQILLARYKTGNKYGTKTIPLPADLSQSIKAYTTTKNLKLGDSLFGSGKLSGFISKFNRDMGLPITINTLREMMVAPVIDTLDSKQRVELAKKMDHAPATSAHYRRKKK